MRTDLALDLVLALTDVVVDLADSAARLSHEIEASDSEPFTHSDLEAERLVLQEQRRHRLALLEGKLSGKRFRRSEVFELLRTDELQTIAKGGLKALAANHMAHGCEGGV